MFLLSTNKYIFTYSFSAQVIQFSAKPHTIHSWGPAHLVTNGLWLSATDHITCVCLVAQSCLTLCDPMDSSTPDSSVHGDSPGKNTGVGYHALLQGIFLTQGWNPGLPDCTWILYCLSHLGISKSKEFKYDETLKLCCKIICGSLELSSIPKLPGFQKPSFKTLTLHMPLHDLDMAGSLEIAATIYLPEFQTYSSVSLCH